MLHSLQIILRGEYGNKKEIYGKKGENHHIYFIILCIFLYFGINYLYQSGGLISNKTHRLLDQGQAYDLGDVSRP